MNEIPPYQENRVPRFLYCVYIIMIIWGIWAFFTYWNGSHGWVDRGYWQRLQEAAHTTFPFEKEKPELEEKNF